MCPSIEIRRTQKIVYSILSFLHLKCKRDSQGIIFLAKSFAMDFDVTRAFLAKLKFSQL